MSLTKEQRDALSPDDFAVPDKRKLPIHDETHTRLAWDQLDRTQGLTNEERTEARKRILQRAKDLGIETKNWHITASISFEAVALDMPVVEGHPNRMPFTGILTRVDQPSDYPPGGSTGACTYIPRDVAEAALPSLLGMAVDFKPNLDGHDKKAKIGIITGATIEGSGVHIEGFFYASDFPEETARIQAEKDRLGFSYECQARIQDLDADPWVVEHCVFTGAAVLRKDKAAYQTTSLAAQADQTLETKMDPELKKVLDAMALSIAALSADVVEVKASAAAKTLDANKTHDKVKPHADKLRACAAAMEADGIGLHEERGHANFLRHMAASMEGEALMSKVPYIYRDHNFIDNKVEAQAAALAAAQASAKADPETTKKLETLEASLASVTTLLTDLKAKAFTDSAAPDRKTISPEISKLLERGGVDLSAGSTVLSAAQADSMFDKLGIKGTSRIEAKLKLRHAGLMETGAVH